MSHSLTKRPHKKVEGGRGPPFLRMQAKKSCPEAALNGSTLSLTAHSLEVAEGSAQGPFLA